MDPAVVPVYTECLRLCGTWLAETCLESPGLILEKYLERVGRVVSSIAVGLQFLSLKPASCSSGLHSGSGGNRGGLD